MNAGASPEEARKLSDAKYPPTKIDIEFEQRLSERGPLIPWGSAISLLIPILSVNSMSASALSETGAVPSVQELIGFGIAQLGWVAIAFGVLVGRFLVFDLDRRWKVFFFGIVMLVLGTTLINT